MDSMKFGETRRAIEIIHNDDTPSIELEIGMAAKVNTSDKEFIYLEQMTDGKWRLTYTGKTIPDFSNVSGFRVVREDEVEFSNVREEDGGLRMSVNGELGRVFLQLLVELFEQNGGKNFLTMTMETPDKSKRYEIRIANLNGDLSVGEKLNQQEAEIQQLKEQLSTLPIAFANHGWEEERYALQEEIIRLKERLRDAGLNED
ncbi:hypothetical protein SAMN02799624_05343 [Paenibacillus sp. UNC496MF]|uniref:hypothetical protein n=1 Tax=Paenibacillus sp. UNC496MF TaxID=1502753 RepID=UPI0008F047DD|nr:hypothetical protein [Paenibacillus sp. UNC496MF]SFJ64460.1 hypothetical protein SAMN02799624_05343 [Paenibacillus sp. UNC496MF]